MDAEVDERLAAAATAAAWAATAAAAAGCIPSLLTMGLVPLGVKPLNLTLLLL